MIHGLRSTRGMAVAPHALAAQSALAVLREGGNAIEAMIAAAATIAVVYPHMNSIGGDGFWLIAIPGEAVRAIEGCGAAAAGASIEAYRARGITGQIPFRGGSAALTVAGTISGWQLAHEFSQERMGGRLPLGRLLEDAVHYAEEGIPATRSQRFYSELKRSELEPVHGFAEAFMPQGAVPEVGSVFRQPRLGATLRALATRGLDDFYRGELARAIAGDLEQASSPLTLADLEAHQGQWRDPLVLTHSAGRIFNTPPPTQGLVSLLILGILDRLGIQPLDPLGADYVHRAVEAVKQSFQVRDAHVTDPRFMTLEASSLLLPDRIEALARRIDPMKAAPWHSAPGAGDTVWMGVIDRAGRAVSFIQSLYHEFGSGVVLASTGINWQNRGCSFALDARALNALAPGRKPFHTLNPALARLNDGSVMVYGAMGGDGQPQTQSAVFTRTIVFGMEPQAAINAPRWLFGRNWGKLSHTLKLESRFPSHVVQELRRRGHVIEVLDDFDDTMGHAGAIIQRPDGVFEGGADPRSDGVVAGY